MSNIVIPYTDDEATAVSLKMDEGCTAGLFSTVKGCLIGAKCKKTHIVSVAIYPGMEGRPRNTDLLVNRYIDPDDEPTSGFERLQALGNCIRRYPYGAPRAQPFHWSIFGAPQRETQSVRPRNERFDMLKSPDGIRSVHGNILVVKSKPSGVVENVELTELFFIERLVYSFFEDANYRMYPMVQPENPLVQYAGEEYAGWGSAWG